jgi:hypothetical protein
MASVTLHRSFLAPAADLSAVLVFFSSGRAENLSVPGEVRRYAGGRLRIVTQAGAATRLSVTARAVSSADLQTMRDLAGAVVLFRDAWGRKMYGAYFDLDVDDYRDRSGHDVKFVLTEVTYSEAVE